MQLHEYFILVQDSSEVNILTVHTNDYVICTMDGFSVLAQHLFG